MSGPIEFFRRYKRVLGSRSAIVAVQAKLQQKTTLRTMRVPGVEHRILLRVPSTDVNTFEEVFQMKVYDLEVARSPDFIIDAGANVGFASVVFANQFPKARIIALEPEDSNFELLSKNVAPYSNVIPLHCALWSEPTDVYIVDPNLGNWGFRTASKAPNPSESGVRHQKIRALTVEQICQQFGAERIDILKVDVEGSEFDIFTKSEPWLHRVGSLIIELHERLVPGCQRTFYDATREFDFEWAKEDTLYLTRLDGCLAIPATSFHIQGSAMQTCSAKVE